jgi:signal transduction histidine kinase/ActR/RegA family two-component response regulator
MVESTLETQPAHELTHPNLLEAQKHVLEMIVRNLPLAEVLRALCQIVERQAHSPAHAAILLVSEDGAGLKTGAAPPLPERAGFETAWSMPIVSADGAVLGTFGTYFTESRAPSSAERQLVEVLAPTAALAIERRRSDAALTADLHDTRMLRDLAARLIAEDDAAALFDELLSAALAITQGDAGTIQVLDEASETLSFVVTRGFEKDILSHFARVSAASGSPCGYALASGRRTFLRFDDPQVPDHDGSNRIHFEHGIRCAQSTPLVSRCGKPVGMLSTHWRTQHQLTERELRFLDLLGRQAADLIERIQARQALRESEQRLREADQRKDEFLAVLAHELRNPMAPIRYASTLIKAKVTDVALKKASDMIERQAGQMARLLDDLLDVSRIARNAISLKLGRLDLRQSIQEAIELARPAIDAQAHRVTVSLPLQQVWVRADAERMLQIIGNLLSNAIKYTEAGGAITIGVTSDAEEATLQISDTGVGFPPEMAPQIFDLFCQVKHTMKMAKGGLGIGLAVVQQLVKLHGGNIVAHSAGLGRGASFSVRLPLTSPPIQSEEDALAEVVPLFRGDLWVLVVEDNVDAAESLAMLLRTSGWSVRVARTAADALQVAEAMRPRIILLDIGLPDMSGHEVARALRREPWGAAARIIAVSGWAQAQDLQRSRESGIDVHLAKPVDPQRLLNLINEFASAQSSSASAHSARR